MQVWEGVLGLSVAFLSGVSILGSMKLVTPCIALQYLWTPPGDLEEFTLVARVLWGFREWRKQLETECAVGRAKIHGIKTLLPTEQ